MELVFDKSEIRYYALLYPAKNDKVVEDLVPGVTRKGFLTSADLLELSNSKLPTGRNTHNIEKNEKMNKGFVKDMTRLAFSAKTELDRICCLCSLKGVSLSVASAILHWFHEDPYPIWDFRALESAQFDEKQYKHWFDGWETYVQFCFSLVHH